MFRGFVETKCYLNLHVPIYNIEGVITMFTLMIKARPILNQELALLKYMKQNNYRATNIAQVNDCRYWRGYKKRIVTR